MIKIGAITIGQSPRTDVTGDILPILGEDVQLLQAGGLDGLTREEIDAMKPEKGDYVLISRLRDGSSAVFAERYILPRLQECIRRLEAEGARLILFLCTGDFPDTFRSSVPLIFPCKVLNGLVPALTGASNIAVVTPTPEQVEQAVEKWKRHVKTVRAVAASPYGDWQRLEEAAGEVAALDADLVVMDCIGYNMEMKRLFQRVTGKNVVLSRTIAARAVAELLA